MPITEQQRAGAKHGLQDLQLRVGRGGSEGDQFVVISPGKHTVGSGPRCTVRIQHPGVRSLHCLIVRDTDGLTVRRWSAGTLLNGRPFDDAALVPGDRLSVGPIQMEVVGGGASEQPSHPQEGSAVPDAARTGSCGPIMAAGRKAKPARPSVHPATSGRSNRGKAQDDAQQRLRAAAAPDARDELAAVWRSAAAVEDLFHQLRAGSVAARNRSRGLLAALRSDRQARDELSQRVNALEQQVQSTRAEREGLVESLQTLQADLVRAESAAHELANLTTAHDELVHLCGQLGDENARLTEEIARQAGELAVLADETDALANENRALAEQRDQSVQENIQLNDRAAKSANSAESLTAQNTALADERDQLADEIGRLQGELAKRSDALAALAHAKEVLSAANMELADRSEHLSHDNVQFRDHIARLTADASTIVAEKEALVEEIRVLANEREHFVLEINSLKSEVDHLTDRQTTQAKQNAALANDKSALAVERAALADENAELVAKLDSLWLQFDDARQQFNGSDWKKIEDGLRQQLAQALLQAADSAAAIGQLERQLAEAQKGEAESVAAQERLAHQLAGAQQQEAASVEVIQDIERQLAEGEQRAVESAARIAQLEQQCAVERQARDAEKRASEAFQQDCETERNRWEDTRRAWTAEKHDWEVARGAQESRERAVQSELSAERAEWRSTIGELEQRLAQQVQRISELEQKLEIASRDRGEQICTESRTAEHRGGADGASNDERADSPMTAAAEPSWNWGVAGAAADAPPDGDPTDATASPCAWTAQRGDTGTDDEQPRDASWEGVSSWGPGAPSGQWSIAAVPDAAVDASQSNTTIRPDGGFDGTGNGICWDDGVAPGTVRRANVPASGGGKEPFSTPDLPDAAAADKQVVDDGKANDLASPPGPGRIHAGPADRVPVDARTDGKPAAPADGAVAGKPTPIHTAPVHRATQDRAHGKSYGLDPAPRPAPGSGGQRTASYIERYAHLFEQEAAADEPLSGAADSRLTESEPARVTAPEDDGSGEESIERYMAKLMQRMRGEAEWTTSSQSPAAKASQAVSSDRSSRPSASQPWPESARDLSSTGVSSASTMPDRPIVNLNEMRRRAAMPEETTDMEALRRLANDTARQAIVTHATHQYRQATMTKLIVAALAGAASVYLMLNAPGWRSIQFGGACVALIAAFVWAFLTLKSLMSAFRARSYEGFSAMEAKAAGADPWKPLLPIDVERTKTSR